MSTTAPEAVFEPGMGHLELFKLDTSEAFLVGFFKDLFENHWKEIQFGMLIQGCVLEISPPGKPDLCKAMDGYLTVVFGEWHIHVCVGHNTGKGCEPTAPEVAEHRKPSSAQLYRKLNAHGEPTFWAFRLLNGKGEQTLHIYLPNPLLTDDHHYAKSPDWAKLGLWDTLRKTYLGLEADPKDRTAKKFSHD